MGDASRASNEVSGRRSFLTKALGFLAGTALLGGKTKALAQVSKKGPDSIGGVKSVQDTSPYLGEILLFAGNFAPVGWAICDGALLSISQNTALFSILGTTYGGDGRTNFALPDLRGRVPVGFGQGSGLSSYVEGQAGGEETHQLSVNEMPSHNHSAGADNGRGTSATPVGNLPAINNEGIQHYGASNNSAMNAAAIGNSGGGQSHNNMQPYLALNYIIALQGVFPSRS
jgi:microcystin-dependent protein